MDVVLERIDQLAECLAKMREDLALLVQQRTVKDWYTTAEVAKFLGKAEFTVREWCRLRRVEARKRACGRGPTQGWIISHEELVRIQNDGLRPRPKH
jgi:DNA-directed RNA polymerase specialized sigma24 family protein